MRIKARLATLEAKLSKVARAKRRIPAIRIYDATTQSQEEIEADITRRYREAGYTHKPGDGVFSVIVDPYPDAWGQDDAGEVPMA